MILSKPKNNSGFTLIETFVAITILLIAVLIPLGVMSKAIQDGLFIKNKVIAYYLAQEGMELVINQIAYNTADATATSWLEYLDVCTNGACYSFNDLEETESNESIKFTACSSNEANDCPYLTQNQDVIGDVYGYNNSNPETIFKRGIKIGLPIISPVGGEMAVPVQVFVYWKNKPGLAEQTLILDDYVFNVGYDESSTL